MKDVTITINLPLYDAVEFAQAFEHYCDSTDAAGVFRNGAMRVVYDEIHRATVALAEPQPAGVS